MSFELPADIPSGSWDPFIYPDEFQKEGNSTLARQARAAEENGGWKESVLAKTSLGGNAVVWNETTYDEIAKWNIGELKMQESDPTGGRLSAVLLDAGGNTLAELTFRSEDGMSDRGDYALSGIALTSEEGLNLVKVDGVEAGAAPEELLEALGRPTQRDGYDNFSQMTYTTRTGGEEKEKADGATQVTVNFVIIGGVVRDANIIVVGEAPEGALI